MKTFTKQLLAFGCLLLLITFPWGCSEINRIVEDHPCCLPEQTAFNTAQNQYNQASATAAATGLVFTTATANVGTTASALATGTIALVNSNNQAVFNLLQTNYNTAVATFNSSLGPLKSALTEKYNKQQAKNTADVALFTCQLTCPANLTCCKGEKIANKTATLAAELATDKLDDEVHIIGSLSTAQTALTNAYTALQQFNNQTCPLSNATNRCITSRSIATTFREGSEFLAGILVREENTKSSLTIASRQANEEKSRRLADLDLCKQTNGCQ